MPDRERKGGLGRLQRRKDFLRVAAGRRKWAAPGLVLQVAPAEPAGPAGAQPAGIRVGFTASRKIGSAVARNRARRRLKALALRILPEHAEPGLDYVLVARQAVLQRSFDGLCDDLCLALRRLQAWRPEG